MLLLTVVRTATLRNIESLEFCFVIYLIVTNDYLPSIWYRLPSNIFQTLIIFVHLQPSGGGNIVDSICEQPITIRLHCPGLELVNGKEFST